MKPSLNNYYMSFSKKKKKTMYINYTLKWTIAMAEQEEERKDRSFDFSLNNTRVNNVFTNFLTKMVIND